MAGASDRTTAAAHRSAAIRSAAVYAFGAALPRAVGLLTLPVYTHVVSPAAYGTFSLLVTIAGAVSLLFSLGLDVAVLRVYFQLADEPERQRQYVNSVWVVLMSVPLLAAFVAAAVAWPLIPDDARFDALGLLLALVGSATAVAATTVPLAVLRAEQRLRKFLIVTTVATLGSSSLSLLFVAGFGWGVRGWLVATILANVATFATAAAAVPFVPPRPLDRVLVRESLVFGAPLVPHSAAHWALQVADRVVIAGIVSASALGVYSLASNLSLPVLMLVQSLNYAFMPTYARAGARTPDEGSSELSAMVVLQAASVAWITAAGALLAPPFIELVAPASYDPAAPLVPWLALGYGLLGLYYIPMNGISLGAGKTRFVPVMTVGCALTNIALLYLLVPGGGIEAAAIASALAYALLLVVVFVYAHRPANPVRYRWRALALVFGSVGAAYAGARVTTADAGGIESLFVRAGWLLLAAAAVAALRSPTRARMRATLRGILAR